MTDSAGAGAAAVWGLWDMPRIWKAEGADALNSGYFLELAGLVALELAGLVALVSLHRDRRLALTPASRTTVALIGVVGLLAAIPFLRVARLNWQSSETGNAAHDVQMTIFAAAVPVLAALIRPEAVGRFVLLGWAVGATGIVIAYWRLLREAGTPLLGIPYVLVALAALAVLAVVNRPWQSQD